jgi:hypothetical protein
VSKHGQIVKLHVSEDDARYRRLNSCGTCAHWQRHDPKAFEGDCHARAPAPQWVDDSTLDRMTLVWPPMDADDWCGEWAARTEPDHGFTV